MAANEAETVCSSSFDTDLLSGDSGGLGHGIAHCGNVWSEPRFLGCDCSIHISYVPSGLSQQSNRRSQEGRAINVLVLRIRRREVGADVTKGGGAQQGVDDGVYQGIAVTMAVGALVVGDMNAAEDEGTSRD